MAGHPPALMMRLLMSDAIEGKHPRSDREPVVTHRVCHSLHICDAQAAEEIRESAPGLHLRDESTLHWPTRTTR